MIFHISTKNKFGKTCKTKQPDIENKGIFSIAKSRNGAKARHPTILQTLTWRAIPVRRRSGRRILACADGIASQRIEIA
jgi:hypothetical protein